MTYRQMDEIVLPTCVSPGVVMRTPAEEQVETGAVLPDLTITLTPTVIASAPATMDLTPLGRDDEGAGPRRSKDVFLNILTTMGLVERYVTDWAGPEALIRGINVKLGVPAYAGDTLTFTGAVVACEDGEFTVRVRGAVSLGDHASGTVRFALP
ncbi:MaoC/PaaZ C-terminal domain-containing protein [Streptosporangium carneum]|uniref:MaoC/PaaZ C-terminal domain-containing protein n=1 Tax=Streptosporangium carneum TaxID=47481 RepID=UPI0022F2E423|nr:MaoC/PaaZ C-terminal domain-containing protein [Streptosporangium carneum]